MRTVTQAIYALFFEDTIVVQPSNEAELCNAVATAIAIDDQPSCFRFPRGNGLGVDFSEYGVAKNFKGTPWEVGFPLLGIISSGKLYITKSVGNP